MPPVPELLVFVREQGTEDYDILYANENISIEEFHALIQDATGTYDQIVKISCEGVAVKNQNGIRFLLKKPEPKLEVVFSGTGRSLISIFFLTNPEQRQAQQGQGQQYGQYNQPTYPGSVQPGFGQDPNGAQFAEVGARPPTGGDNKWCD